MEKSLRAIVAIAVIALLGATGCATKGPVQEETVVLQEQVAPIEQEPEDPCTTLLDALARAEKLSNDNFYGATVVGETIQFEFDSDALSAEAKATLDDFVASLKGADTNFFIELQGHTDDFGTDEYNFQLGLARARAAMGYLYSQYGISLQSMNGFSCGESKPVAENTMSTGRAINRRVTFVVIE
jgi:outer membrane protein OmpA-like peptidoglycan-associated protein